MSYLTKKELDDVVKLKEDIDWLAKEITRSEFVIEDGLSEELTQQSTVLEEMFTLKSGGTKFE